MSPVTSAIVVGHTTASSPKPHILYNVQVTTSDGVVTTIAKRYSDFVALHDVLNDPGTLPPKRILVTSFIPSAWLDDALIAERKTGLSAYLTGLIESPSFSSHKSLSDFLTPTSSATTAFNPEDALPSTLSRKAALDMQAALRSGEVSTQASPIAAAYYTSWSVDTRPPSSLDFSKFDLLFFAFAAPNASNGVSFDAGTTTTLSNLVTAAHNSGKGTKVVLSIGGWTGSTYFSQALASGNRPTFVNAVVDVVNTYNLDGVDIDWEYPNESGAGNPHGPADAANLLSLFQDLRARLGPSKIISAAVTVLPWKGPNGQPLTDVSAYAKVMTYANIMNYDTWGASANPGPNAPLGNLCGNSTIPQYSAQAGRAQWVAAGFPASQLLLGLPLYGYVYNSTKTTLNHIALPPPGFRLQEAKEQVIRAGPACPVPVLPRDDQEEKTVPLSDVHDRRAEQARKGEVEVAAAGDLSAFFGQAIALRDLVRLGALAKNADGLYTGVNGYTFAWDDCSDTPFIYNTARSTVVCYDDQGSLGDKARFALENGMAGTFTWALDQDDGYTLQDAIRAALGK